MTFRMWLFWHGFHLEIIFFYSRKLIHYSSVLGKRYTVTIFISLIIINTTYCQYDAKHHGNSEHRKVEPLYYHPRVAREGNNN